MQGFTYIDLIILVVYLAAVLFAGLHFAKKEMKGKEYFKGDGTVPWWVTSVSTLIDADMDIVKEAAQMICDAKKKYL